MTEIEPGTTVGAFTVMRVIGTGATSVVYAVRDVSTDTTRALKVLPSTLPHLRERFLREAAALAKIDHPNVLRVFEVLEIGSRPALLLELIDGPDLEAALDRYAFNLDQIDDVARQLIAGVGAAHAQGVVHRDLKPANVLLAPAGSALVPKVADFGIARLLASDVPRRTVTGATMGTPAYMAPEQFRDAKRADERADVFALGAVLYELVTGRHAFDANDTVGFYRAASSRAYRPIPELSPSAPARMVRAIDAALEPDLEARAPDVAAIERLWNEAGTTWEGHHLAAIAGDSDNVAVPTRIPTDATAAVTSDPAPVHASWTLATAPPPESVPKKGHRWWRPALLAAIVSGGVGLGCGLGMGGVVGAWSSGGSDPGPVATPVAAPEGPTTHATPPDAPSLEPVPTPGIAAAPVPRSPPRSPLPAVSAPDPAPRAPDRPVTALDVTSDVGVYLLSDAGKRLPPGPVAPGEWAVYLELAEGPRRAVAVTVGEGERLSYRCTRALASCTPVGQ